MDALVAKPELVGHLELTIRKQRGAQPMFGVPLGKLARRVRADCDDLHTALVELGPEFFPSPQLGDTIRSPVTAKELDERGVARQARRVERLTVFVEGGKGGNLGSHLDAVGRDLLVADCDRK